MLQSNSPYRVAFYTMGCKTNQYDSHRLAEEFEASGFAVVPFRERADVYVINTCTVTAEADREARRAVRQALSRSPGALVVATGCYPEVDPAPIQSISGVALVGGNALKAHLVRRVQALLDTKERRAAEGVTTSYPKVASRTRRVLKIQEGCNYRCAYCVVPRARGRARSRPLDEVLAEARRYVADGVPELVLTGTCLGSYGQDLWPRIRLAECVATIAEIPGLKRLRLSSIEPWEVDDSLIDLVAEHPVVCQHFHLPLQSGDDHVRRRMRRPGSRAHFAALVACIREKMPCVAITTDVMVGYPGETDEEFQATLEFCRAMAFSRMHVFPYSPRPFTFAATQENQVPRAVKEARRQALTRLGQEMANSFARRWVGQVVPVLVEGAHGPQGLLEGLTEQYVRVCFPGDEGLRGQVVNVETFDVQEGCLLGRIAGE